MKGNNMGRARNNAPEAVEEIKDIEVPADAEEITEEEANKLEANAVAPEAVEGQTPAEQLYKVEAPNKKYTGTTATVDFVNGVGYTNNKVIADYFKARNFVVS